MNYPVWYLPSIGGGTLIALIAVTHVFVSHFTLDKLELVPQYSPLVLFLCALAAGAGVLAWLVRAYAVSR